MNTLLFILAVLLVCWALTMLSIAIRVLWFGVVELSLTGMVIVTMIAGTFVGMGFLAAYGALLIMRTVI